VFVTQDDETYIRARARAIGVPEERLVITSAARQDVPLYLSLARFGIFFIRPTYSKMASSPTKQGEIMAMGLPIVCNSGVGDTDEIVRQFGSGLLVQSFDAVDYDSAAAAMDECTFAPETIVEGADAYFGLAGGQATYRAIYDRLLGRVA
jgi:glycosyltransferase involved in cell wall biosynthesis